MRWLTSWLTTPWFSKSRPKKRRGGRRAGCFETLETRQVLSADPLPVLMVIADKADFYYREYSETRQELELAGLNVVVAASTTDPSTPHWNSGQIGAGTVVPDLALAQVNADDYSAIIFVGGWGASMYQYAYNDPNFDGVTDNFYVHAPYNGDPDLNDGVIAEAKVIVNNLINELVASERYVAAICHGVTVLAWARVDGASPIAGRQVAVPHGIGSPDQFYDGQWRSGGYLDGQYQQVLDNGALPTPSSGAWGDPTTAADDVIVDGRIITAENFDSSAMFGQVIATQVLAWHDAQQAPPVEEPIVEEPPVEEPPVEAPPVEEPIDNEPIDNEPIDNEPIDNEPIDNEPIDNEPIDNEPIEDEPIDAEPIDAEPIDAEPIEEDPPIPSEPVPGVHWVADDLVVPGTDGPDVIYLWSGPGGQFYVWMNEVQHGPFVLPAGGNLIVHGHAGNDRIFATDLYISASIYGGAGHDLITGGHGNDLIDGGDGVDRISGGPGDDILIGGDGDDHLYGGSGNNLLLGGAGDDFLLGGDGNDILIGGPGTDWLRGAGGEDLLIGGTTDYDHDIAALRALLELWSDPAPLATRIAALTDPAASIRLLFGDTVHGDESRNALVGGDDDDWFIAAPNDVLYTNAGDHVS